VQEQHKERLVEKEQWAKANSNKPATRTTGLVERY